MWVKNGVFLPDVLNPPGDHAGPQFSDDLKEGEGGRWPDHGRELCFSALLYTYSVSVKDRASLAWFF